MKRLLKLRLLAVALIVGVVPLGSSLRAYADTLGATASYALANSSPDNIAEDNNGNLWVTGRVYNSNTWHMDYYAYKISRTTGAYTTYVAYPDWSDMTIGPDNNVWAIDTYINKTDTTTGARSIYYPNASYGNTATPTAGLAAGPDGNVWFGMSGTTDSSGQTTAVSRIGRINTGGMFQTAFNLDVVVTSLVGDETDNVVWFTGRYATGGGGVVGSITPAGVQTLYVTSTTSIPGQVTLGPDGNVWFNMGTNQVGKMTPSGSVIYYTLTPPGNLQRTTWGKDGYLWATIYNKNQVARIATDGTATYYTLPGTEAASDIIGGRDGNIWAVTTNAHQLIKVGSGYTDNDEDGVTAEQETTQGTSDSAADTDSDGLSDYVESQWNVKRNDEFCDGTATSCAYPDPLHKDIYVETDWMDTANYSEKPTDSQLAAVSASFAIHGITVHFDNGTYGGGQQVPLTTGLYWKSTSGSADFLDYKYGGDGISDHFSLNRDGIWHYMLFGYNYAEDTGSSGVATVGGPDAFISYGLIKDNPASYSSFDTALEGTIIHELGHTLCLSNASETYTGQPSACVYSGIDNSAAASTYHSSMNYLYQFNQVDYSAGQNGATNDHDDWSALTLKDFNRMGGGAHGLAIGKENGKKFHARPLVHDARLPKVRK